MAKLFRAVFEGAYQVVRGLAECPGVNKFGTGDMAPIARWSICWQVLRVDVYLVSCAFVCVRALLGISLRTFELCDPGSLSSSRDVRINCRVLGPPEADTLICLAILTGA